MTNREMNGQMDRLKLYSTDWLRRR